MFVVRIFLAASMALLFGSFATSADGQQKFIDLTYPFSSETHHWPTAQPFHFEKVSEGRTAGGFWYSSYNYGGSEHVGTHMDAPFHFAEGKWTAEQVPLERLVGPGVVIDMQQAAEKNVDYLLQLRDIQAWEKLHGRIPPHSIVLIRSGWGKYWHDRKRYFGSAEPGNVTDLHFPGLGKEAAQLLIQRQIKAVGIDTPSIDHGPSKEFIAHQLLGAANIPIFENVAGLERLRVKGTTIYAIPMKIKGGSGAPLRIFALAR